MCNDSVDPGVQHLTIPYNMALYLKKVDHSLIFLKEIYCFLKFFIDVIL